MTKVIITANYKDLVLEDELSMDEINALLKGVSAPWPVEQLQALVLTGFAEKKHNDPHHRREMARVLLLMTCANETGEAILRYANQGGVRVTYDILQTSPGQWGFGISLFPEPGDRKLH